VPPRRTKSKGEPKIINQRPNARLEDLGAIAGRSGNRKKLNKISGTAAPALL
jgi:hypothetical protein